MMTLLKKYKFKLLLPFVGGAVGYAYYYFIGCASGSCPITSNPYISTIYGTVVASLFLVSEKKKEIKDADNN